MKRPVNHVILREICLDRDNLKCVKCNIIGRRREYSNKELNKPLLIADHIIPLAMGGDHFLENMQTLCQDCNREKNKKDQSNIAKFKRGNNGRNNIIAN